MGPSPGTDPLLKSVLPLPLVWGKKKKIWLPGPFLSSKEQEE